jgi:DNA-binding NtrC family response regulator
MKVVLLAPASPDRASIAEWLGASGCEVATCELAPRALELVGADARFALVDLTARQEARSFLRSLLTGDRTAWCIAIADRRDAGATADALRFGVIDIVTRPLREQDLLAALANAREFASIAGRKPVPAERPAADGLHTQSPRMREICEMARRVAPSRCPVLLVGERGTGRETLARHIHANGTLREAAFVKLPGAAPVSELRESLHDSTPASTVYIEEVGEMDSDAQLALERWLSAVHGLDGATHRLIAAAQPGIFGLIERRAFRSPLFEALSVVRFDLPTLRERPQDIPLLALSFLKESCARHGVQPKTFSRSALALLSSLPWRGNAAELRGLVERLALMVPRGVILQEDVLQHVRFDDAQARGASTGSLREARRQFEREFIASTLQRHGWRMESAASALGIERTNLYRKIKQLAIVRGDGRT